MCGRRPFACSIGKRPAFIRFRLTRHFDCPLSRLGSPELSPCFLHLMRRLSNPNPEVRRLYQYRPYESR